jgi:hypothetical protein
MSEPNQAAAALKELVKDPLFYVIAVFVLAGTTMITHDNKVGATWGVGLGMIVFSAILLILQIVASLYDSSFKRRYNDALDAQSKALKDQRRSISALSKQTVAASVALPTELRNSDQLAGGYRRDVGTNEGNTTTNL